MPAVPLPAPPLIYPCLRWCFMACSGLPAIAAAIVLVVDMHGGGLSEPAFPRGTDLLSAQDSMQIFSVEGDLIGVRRGKAGLRQDRADPRHTTQGNHSGRGRALLRTRRGAITSVWYAPHCPISPPPVPTGASTSPCKWHETLSSTRRLSAASSMKALLAFKIEHSLTKDEILRFISTRFTSASGLRFARPAGVLRQTAPRPAEPWRDRDACRAA